jgi:hypothetical protein
MTNRMERNLLKCEYLKEDNCSAVMMDEEGKEARHEGCKNDNKNACCYLCPFNHNCEISCEYLGEKDYPIKECPLCASEMYPAKVNLRIGGWMGLWKLVPFGELGELGEELLPVVVYTCSNCGKLEFFTREKTKIEKITNAEEK